MKSDCVNFPNYFYHLSPALITSFPTSMTSNMFVYILCAFNKVSELNCLLLLLLETVF